MRVPLIGSVSLNEFGFRVVIHLGFGKGELHVVEARYAVRPLRYVRSNSEAAKYVGDEVEFAGEMMDFEVELRQVHGCVN